MVTLYYFQLTDLLIKDLGKGNFDILDVTFRYLHFCNVEAVSCPMRTCPCVGRYALMYVTGQLYVLFVNACATVCLCTYMRMCMRAEHGRAYVNACECVCVWVCVHVHVRVCVYAIKC